MRIVLFGTLHRRIGALEGNRVIDLHRAYTEALREAGNASPERTALERLGSDLEGFISNGTAALDAAEEAINHVTVNGAEGGLAEQLSSVKLHAPWPRRRLAMVGGNYADHLAGMQGGSSMEEITQRAREQGQWGFWKEAHEVAGPGDDITYPKRTEYLDYEAEAAIVIGKRGKDIPADRIDDYVWGVTLIDDVSIRDGMGRVTGMSYNLAKNFDGSTAMGPAIAVRENIDFQKIDVELKINDEIRQHFNNSAMIFSFGEVIEWLSRDFTFVPGDIISGGTAMGTAADKTPKPAEGAARAQDLFLKVGDTIEISSPQVGSFTNRIV